MAARAVGIFQALEGEQLTTDEIAKHFGSDLARRWLSRDSLQSLHSAILHRNLDLRFMNFEDYVMYGKCQDFHSGLRAEDWEVYHYSQADHAAQMIDEVIDRIPLPPDASDLPT